MAQELIPLSREIVYWDSPEKAARYMLVAGSFHYSAARHSAPGDHENWLSVVLADGNKSIVDCANAESIRSLLPEKDDEVLYTLYQDTAYLHVRIQHSRTLDLTDSFELHFCPIMDRLAQYPILDDEGYSRLATNCSNAAIKTRLEDLRDNDDTFIALLSDLGIDFTDDALLDFMYYLDSNCNDQAQLECDDSGYLADDATDAEVYAELAQWNDARKIESEIAAGQSILPGLRYDEYNHEIAIDNLRAG